MGGKSGGSQWVMPAKVKIRQAKVGRTLFRPCEGAHQRTYPLSSMILAYCSFLDVCEGVRAMSTGRHIAALDPVQMDVVARQPSPIRR